MNVTVMNEAGYEEAMFGLGLCKKLTSEYSNWNQVPVETQERIKNVAVKLFDKDMGHNKFLESMTVWLDINAPIYFWQHFDTYRVGVTKNSESKMHTLMRLPISQSNFEGEDIPEATLNRLNELRSNGEFDKCMNELPQSYLQRRIVATNYKTLRNIINQRNYEKLGLWRTFNDAIIPQLKYQEFIVDLKKVRNK